MSDDGRRVITALFITLNGTYFEAGCYWPAEAVEIREWENAGKTVTAHFELLGVISGRVIYEEMQIEYQKAVYLN